MTEVEYMANYFVKAKDMILNFGKHRGKSVAEFPIEYCYWLLAQPWLEDHSWQLRNTLRRRVYTVLRDEFAMIGRPRGQYPVLTFGRYKGKAINELEFDYGFWLLSQPWLEKYGENLRTALKWRTYKTALEGYVLPPVIQPGEEPYRVLTLEEFCNRPSEFVEDAA
jgi:uncharacterized protein (DUF3820 family)